MPTGIINRIGTAVYDNLTSGALNPAAAVNAQLQLSMHSWAYAIFAVITIFIAYIRTGSLAYAGALGLTTALLMFEMPIYIKAVIWIVVILGLAMALFKVFGRRER